MTIARAWMLALLFACGLLALGCPANQCLLKVCTNGNCYCSISSCTDGAAYDVNQNRCRCLKDFISIGGQCLSLEEANAYCGVGYHWGGQGCVESQCKPGDELDLSTGWCIPKSQVDQVAGQMGVSVGEGQKLGCPPGEKLVVDGTVAACVPLSQTCAPDETWTGSQCHKVVICATGSTWDTALGKCVQYAQSGDDLIVDVQQWAMTHYGPPGGLGTTAFCGPFAKKPYSFGVTEGNTAFLRIQVDVAFPDQAISKALVKTSAVFEVSNTAVPAKGAGEVDKSAAGILASLAQGGGRASAASASTTVRCAVVNASKPQAVPAIPASGGV